MALVQDIKSRNQEFMKAFSSGDATGAAAVYAPDCYFMPHGREAVRGRAGAEAYFKQDMAEGVKSVTLDTDEVNGSGDWCFERGHYRLDGSRGSETGSEKSKHDTAITLIDPVCKCWTPYLPPVSVFHWRPVKLFPKPGIAVKKSRYIFPKVPNFVGIFGNKICATGSSEQTAPAYFESNNEET